MSATCRYCQQPMDPGVACTDPTYDDIPGHGPVARIPYPPDDTDWPANCTDCNTPHGGLHHPGCCVERCPNPDPEHRWQDGRRLQAISCGCGEEAAD